MLYLKEFHMECIFIIPQCCDPQYYGTTTFVNLVISIESTWLCQYQSFKIFHVHFLTNSMCIYFPQNLCHHEFSNKTLFYHLYLTINFAVYHSISSMATLMQIQYSTRFACTCTKINPDNHGDQLTSNAQVLFIYLEEKMK